MSVRPGRSRFRRIGATPATVVVVAALSACSSTTPSAQATLASTVSTTAVTASAAAGTTAAAIVATPAAETTVPPSGAPSTLPSSTLPLSTLPSSTLPSSTVPSPSPTTSAPLVTSSVSSTTVPLASGEVRYRVPVADVAAAGWSSTHAGYPATDVFAACGAELVAPVDGVVLEVRRTDDWSAEVDNPATRGGRSIAVLGDDGVRYYLAHLDEVATSIEPGVRVAAGDPVGTVGETGRSGACHVHVGFSPPCPGPEWSVRRGVVWPSAYLDDWRDGGDASPRAEVEAWSAANADACAEAMADPNAADAGGLAG